MIDTFYIILGILLPFFGTSIGSFFVFFLKRNISDKLQSIIIGIASGVMIAASVWSLIIPSINLSSNMGIFKWVPSTIGFMFGIIFLIVINNLAKKIETSKNLNMLMFSVTLHNIPEGMAVGVAFAGVLSESIFLIEAMLLSIGISIQNIPEGAIISMPLKMEGKNKRMAFLYGVLSGIVEPISAILTILLTNIIVPVLPYLLSFAAGAMIYVVCEELIPEIHSNGKSQIGVIGIGIGFIIMMILDITLG